jgi:hypothetical protein
MEFFRKNIAEVHCGILHLRDLTDSYQINLEHENFEKKEIFKDFERIYQQKIGKIPQIQNGLYISPVFLEDKLMADSEDLRRFLGKFLKAGAVDFVEIKNTFAELYMNICQHAQTEKGYIYISEPT